MIMDEKQSKICIDIWTYSLSIHIQCYIDMLMKYRTRCRVMGLKTHFLSHTDARRIGRLISRSIYCLGIICSLKTSFLLRELQTLSCKFSKKQSEQNKAIGIILKLSILKYFDNQLKQ